MELPKTKPKRDTSAATAAAAQKRLKTKLAAATALLRENGAYVAPPSDCCGHAIVFHGTVKGLCMVGDCTCDQGPVWTKREQQQ